jgi:hypothetical protein
MEGWSVNNISSVNIENSTDLMAKYAHIVAGHNDIFYISLNVFSVAFCIYLCIIPVPEHTRLHLLRIL